MLKLKATSCANEGFYNKLIYQILSFSIHALSVRSQGLLQSVRVGTNHLLDDLAVLEEDDGWHRRNLVLLGNLTNLVNVNLDELSRWVLLGEFVQQWSNHLTRTTPGGEEVNDDQTVVLESFLEFGFGGNLGDHYDNCCFV